MSQKQYIHGYTERERQRLIEQGAFLEEMIYEDIDFSNCKHVLEIGCGVGAHLKIILSRYPNLKVTGVDIDATQIEQAEQNLKDAGFDGRFTLLVADATELTLNTNDLPDGAIFCWVLEHLNNPIEVLTNVRKNLQPNSRVYLTEVYNNGFYVQPTLPNLTAYWQAYNQLQLQVGGDIVAGVKLGYHLHTAGYKEIQVKQVYQFHDARDKVKRNVMANYLYNLMMSGSEQLVAAGLINQTIVDGLKPEFEILCEREDAIIFYPGFKASARS